MQWWILDVVGRSYTGLFRRRAGVVMESNWCPGTLMVESGLGDTCFAASSCSTLFVDVSIGMTGLLIEIVNVLLLILRHILCLNLDEVLV